MTRGAMSQSGGDNSSGNGEDFALYRYTPSVVAAAVVLAFFSITTFLHTYQLFRTRTWFFIAFLCGGYSEVVGYAARIYSAEQNPNFTLGPYVVQQVLLLIAPALFAASIYMELGRIGGLLDPTGAQHLLILPRRWITRTFVCGDVICFLMQAGGASLMANDSPSVRDTGSHLVVGGLFVQIVSFGGFVITAVIFHQRARRRPLPHGDETAATVAEGERAAEKYPYQRHLFALYASSVMIFARSIVRAAEFIQGFDGVIYNHEAYLYGFDAAPMFLTMIIFNWIHPSEIKALLKGGTALRGVKLIQL